MPDCLSKHQSVFLAVLLFSTIAVGLVFLISLSQPYHALFGENKTYRTRLARGTLNTTLASPPKTAPLIPKNPPVIPEDAPVMCMQFIGRLGNELFSAAGLLGLAFTLGRRPVFLKPQYLPQALQVVPYVAGPEDTERCKKAKGVSSGGGYRWHPEVMRQVLQPKDFTSGSHLLSFLYFDRHKAEILTLFTMKDSIRREADRIIQNIRKQYQNDVTVVGMHMRRGDYVPPHKQAMGYVPAPESYARQAVAFYRARYPDAVFLISSDSLDYFQERLKDDKRVHYLPGSESPGSPPTNLWTLASCDHVAISFGTFSWWVGYINAARGGTVVYTKDFISKGTMVGDSFDPMGETFYPPSWIPL